MLVQIYLAQNRTDLALKEVAGAKRWANDSLLINLAESWTNLRVGGSEKYQSAFYVFEELATSPGNTSSTALVGQAVSEIHLGRWEEAQVALDQAVAMEGASVESIANSLVLASITGKNGETVQSLMKTLKSRDPNHALVKDLEEKSSLFDTAAQKYSAKFSIMTRTFLATIPRSWVDKATPKIASDVDRGDMIRIGPTMEKAEGMNTLPPHSPTIFFCITRIRTASKSQRQSMKVRHVEPGSLESDSASRVLQI